MIQFEQFETISEVCLIQKYSIYESKEDESTHSAFGDASISDSNVVF